MQYSTTRSSLTNPSNELANVHLITFYYKPVIPQNLIFEFRLEIPPEISKYVFEFSTSDVDQNFSNLKLPTSARLISSKYYLRQKSIFNEDLATFILVTYFFDLKFQIYKVENNFQNLEIIQHNPPINYLRFSSKSVNFNTFRLQILAVDIFAIAVRRIGRNKVPGDFCKHIIIFAV